MDVRILGLRASVQKSSPVGTVSSGNVALKAAPDSSTVIVSAVPAGPAAMTNARAISRTTAVPVNSFFNALVSSMRFSLGQVLGVPECCPSVGQCSVPGP